MVRDAQELGFVPCSHLFLGTWERFASQIETGLGFSDAAIAVRRFQKK
jgi:hypothetical protein